MNRKGDSGKKNRQDTTYIATHGIPRNTGVYEVGNAFDAFAIKATNEIHQAKWVEDLSVSTKADTFKSFKTKVNFEKYLEDLKNRKHRVAMTKIRMSDHNLMIEDGRRLRPRIERSQRTCPICPNSVEDECHFLVTCPIYKDRDVIFLKTERTIPAFKSMNNKAKFVFLLSQEDTNINKDLAACIQKWFCLRQTITQSITQ